MMVFKKSRKASRAGLIGMQLKRISYVQLQYFSEDGSNLQTECKNIFDKCNVFIRFQNKIYVNIVHDKMLKNCGKKI